MADAPLPDCNRDVFDNGTSVGLFVIPKETAEAICLGISAATGARVDWHYIAGRVHIKALPPRAPSPVNTKTHGLLSTLIGILLRNRQKIGYTDNSPVAKAVAEAVDHLKDWPYPETQPPRPGTAPLSDEMRRQMIEECGDDYEKRGIFASGWLGAERAHGIGHPTTPTPKD